MNWIRSTRTFPLSLALLVPLLALPAMAALGGDVASVQKDAEQFKAEIRSSQKQGYAVHEMRTSSGTTVREYVSPAGKVFGVTWQGPFIPDLQQLLGTSYERFTAAAKNRHGVHGPLSINESGLVLVSGGHMRSYRGTAYIPQMLPEGVQADAIQ
jgi:Protein of unknown function (DUF2844)